MTWILLWIADVSLPTLCHCPWHVSTWLIIVTQSLRIISVSHFLPGLVLLWNREFYWTFWTQPPVTFSRRGVGLHLGILLGLKLEEKCVDCSSCKTCRFNCLGVKLKLSPCIRSTQARRVAVYQANPKRLVMYTPWKKISPKSTLVKKLLTSKLWA